MKDSREILGFNKARFTEGVGSVVQAGQDLAEGPFAPNEAQVVERFIASQLIPFLTSPIFTDLPPGSRILISQVIEHVTFGTTLAGIAVDNPTVTLEEYAGLRETGGLGTTSELREARQRLEGLSQELKQKE